MHRATAQSQSAPQLPLPSHQGGAHALTSTISASLLPLADTSDRPDKSSRVFVITDLLQERADDKLRLVRKRAKPGAGPPGDEPGAFCLPLSPIQHGRGSKDPMRQQVGPNHQYLGSLDRPENTELFTYASALCHRITGKYMAKELLQNDPSAQKNEIARIQRDPELLQAITIIKTLSKEFKDVAHATLGHRKELGHTLLRIEESYLKLFEKLMELSLRMYWKYEQDQGAERRADKATITYWQDLFNAKTGEASKLQKLLEGKEILARAQQIELRDWERQCAELQREVGDQRALQGQIFELQAVERGLRHRERIREAEYEALKTKHDEMKVNARALLEEAHMQHKHMMDEMRHTLREHDQQLSQQSKAIRDLTVLATPVVTTTSSTQTEVSDDGLWDAQDGIPRFVSRDLQHRLAWRRFHAFAVCKNCHGRPIQQRRMAITKDPGSIAADDAYVDVWSLTRGERKSKKAVKRIDAIEAEWQLPQAIGLFLSNLPKSVVAFPFYSLNQVVQQIELIYDDKFESDIADEADGVAREELPSFICEYFLKTHGLRQSAEIGLYRFLVSVKNLYRGHSHLHLFTRFCGLLVHDGTTSTHNDAAVGAGTLMETLVERPRRTELDRSFLRVFLHARHIILVAPPPKFSKKGQIQPPPPQPFVVQVESLKKWVPLDHAVSVVRWYLTFLPEDLVISYCREVEYSTAIYAGGAITEIAGNRLAVRAEMRKSMLTNGDDGEGHGAQLSDKERRRRPRIVADVHRVLLLLMHALEQRRDVVEKALVVMFEAGDVNHDCVLSLDEFKAIIRGRAHTFSDRRLLRMFREALMGGSDQSFALSMDAFVKVCNDHGLVTLLPDDRWADPFFHKATDPAAANAKQGLSAVKKAPTALNVQAVGRREGQPLAKEEIEAIPEDLPPDESRNMALLSPRATEVEEEDLWGW